MALEQFLNPGEDIVWDRRKHWAEWFGFLGWCAFMFLILMFPVLLMPPIFLLNFPLFLWLAFTLRPRRAVYVVTNRRVFAVRGLLSRSVEELPLEQVVTIEVREPLRQRLFGCGCLVFNPIKADSGVEAAPLTLDRVPGPHEFRRIVLKQREQLARERVGMAASLVAAMAAEARPVAVPALPAPAREVWYFTRNGERHGPVSAKELRRLARSGDLAPEDLVWKEGMDRWAPAARLEGLFQSGRPAGRIA